MSTTNPETGRPANYKPTPADRADEMIREIADRVSLDGWNAFVDNLALPADMLPALMTGRPELAKLAVPRAANVDEVAKLYKAIAVLIDTNAELRRHAQEVATMVVIWADSFKQLRSLGGRIESFAQFRTRAEIIAGEEDES